MRKVILLTAMPKESVWSSSIYVNGGGLLSSKISFSRILLLFVCCIVCNNVFAQNDHNWQLVQDFESLTSNDVKACTTDGEITTNATVSIDTEANHGNFGKLHKPSSGEATYGIVFSVSLGTNNLSDYSYLKIETYTTNAWKNLGIYVRQTSTSSTSKGFQLIGYKNNGFENANTWTTQTVEITTTGYNYSDVDFFIAAVDAWNDMYIQIDNIQLDGPAIPSSPVEIEIDETKNNTFTAKRYDTVKLYRTLTAGMWNTICLPFVPTEDQAKTIFGTTAKFAEFSSVSNDGVMQFTSVDFDELQAGTPYLVLPSQDKTAESPIELTGVTITVTEPETVSYGNGNYQFKGIYSPTPFAIADWDAIRFVGTGNNLLKPSVSNPDNPNESNPLKALRAYFRVPGASGAKNYTFAVDSFVPTSIANIQIEGDGDGAIYNIGGQRVEGKSLPKGIYIRDGKKFVVK